MHAEIDAPVRYEDGIVYLLDQTRLPSEEVWLTLRRPDEIAEAIRSLRVRGAPLIGITAAYGIAAAARAGADLDGASALMRSSRPTAVNLAWACDRVMDRVRDAAGRGVCGDGLAEVAESEAAAIEAFEVASCDAIGRHGAQLIPQNARVMTYCNTGTLATGGIGTALGVIRTAFTGGRLKTVWVPETRPLLQGARLTAWELQGSGIPFRVITESATGSVFARGDVDAVIVGADRIAANGDTANKVGTYVLAVLAARHAVPFYVAAPTSTVDALAASGENIPIEERPPEEVTSFGDAFNPAFDVTPGGLITAIVTECGPARPPYGF